MDNNYIAYLDLLGTKNSRGDYKAYYENMLKFTDTLRTFGICLKKEANGKLVMFNDGAFVESSDLSVIISFLADVRDHLIVDGLFFKAALTKGKLDVDPLNGRDDVISGIICRSPDASAVYSMQESFKGIGIWIDPEVANDKETVKNYNDLKDKLVKSVYIESDEKSDNYKTIKYTDVKIRTEYDGYNSFSKELARTVLEACLKAYTQSPKFGRYYLSLLATIIKSSSKSALSELKWNRAKIDDKNPNGLSFDNCPYIFNLILKMVCSDDFNYISALDVLCFLIMESAFEQRNSISPDDKRSIVYAFSQYGCIQKYNKNIDAIPDILSDSVRIEFIKYYKESLIEAPLDNLFRNL